MALISIREHGATTDIGMVVSIDGLEYPFALPVAELDRLSASFKWYFDEYPNSPFDQERAESTARMISEYGEILFNHVFADRRAYRAYVVACCHGMETIEFEVVGSAMFHSRHWEALKDPDLPLPLALECAFVRRSPYHSFPTAIVRESPTINILIVTSRIYGSQDIGYRSITRPIVHALRSTSRPYNLEVISPTTLSGLGNRLNERGNGYYHIVHFDVHGALLTYDELTAFVGRKAPDTSPDGIKIEHPQAYHLPPFQGTKAFLIFEKDGVDGLAAEHVVDGDQLASLLTKYRVPIVLLNSCQSGRQTGNAMSSIGSALMKAGVEVSIAVQFSITESAAAVMMDRLYSRLVSGNSLTSIIQHMRFDLFNRKTRIGLLGLPINLHDWILPVVFIHKDPLIRYRDFTLAESAAYYQRHARINTVGEESYEFAGNEVDVATIHRLLFGPRISSRNILIVSGADNNTKRLMLRHLAWWWSITNCIDRPFYVELNHQRNTACSAQNLEGVVEIVAHDLLGNAEFLTHFDRLDKDARRALVESRLRSESHLLVLDGVDSFHDVQTTIGFVSNLKHGRSIVILSIADETWPLRCASLDAQEYRLGTSEGRS